LGRERVHLLGTSEPRIIDDPKSTVLLPWEVAQKMIFGVDVVAKCLGAEECVDIATVRKLAEDLYENVQHEQENRG
jgi:hypothetical protein